VSITGWPAVFALLAGAGAVTFLVGTMVLPASPALQRKTQSFDFVGMLLLALSLGAYALSTTLGGAHPGFTNAALAVVAGLGVAAFVLVESRTASPLLQLELLRDRHLTAGLVALALVSTIMMATLVVGPFYLSKGLALGPVETGLIMSIGPAVAALIGLPAGRLVDTHSSAKVTISGLLAVVAGTALMTVLPVWFGTLGYIAGLSTITAGYALFQAANNTGVMASAASDRRGLTSALLGLARNLGLITGASAMGVVFAIGSQGLSLFGLSAGAQTGMQVTFGVACLLACVALANTAHALSHPFRQT